MTVTSEVLYMLSRDRHSSDSTEGTNVRRRDRDSLTPGEAESWLIISAERCL
jgi:hypothetical protein